MDGLFGALIRLIFFLPIVAVLAYLSIKYLGKSQQFRGTAHLQVIDRIALSPKASICVVKVVDAYFLLAVNEQQTTLIKELDDYPCSEHYMMQEFMAAPLVNQLNEAWQTKFKQRGKTS